MPRDKSPAKKRKSPAKKRKSPAKKSKSPAKKASGQRGLKKGSPAAREAGLLRSIRSKANGPNGCGLANVRVHCLSKKKSTAASARARKAPSAWLVHLKKHFAKYGGGRDQMVAAGESWRAMGN